MQSAGWLSALNHSRLVVADHDERVDGRLGEDVAEPRDRGLRRFVARPGHLGAQLAADPRRSSRRPARRTSARARGRGRRGRRTRRTACSTSGCATCRFRGRCPPWSPPLAPLGPTTGSARLASGSARQALRSDPLPDPLASPLAQLAEAVRSDPLFDPLASPSAQLAQRARPAVPSGIACRSTVAQRAAQRQAGRRFRGIVAPMQTLFVTGGAGFIGSNFVRLALERTARACRGPRQADLRGQPREPDAT